MTTATEIKLMRVKHAMGYSPDAAYVTADGRFLVHRPERSADSWGVEDTQRWTWHFDSQSIMPGIVVDHDYHPWSLTLAECKALIARLYERGEELTQNTYRTEAEARAAGQARLAEDRRERIERRRLEEERKRHPAPGPWAYERVGEGIHLIHDAHGSKVAQTDTVGNARMLAESYLLADTAENFLEAALAANCLPAEALEMATLLRTSIARARGGQS